MRVSKDDMICGVSAPVARQMMRAYYADHSIGVACDVLGLDQHAARNQLRAFEAAGYLERREMRSTAGDDWWATTIKGNALAQASFGKPISRATATRHLAQVIERARGYNADPARLLTIAEIAVFGSYLDPAVDRLGRTDTASRSAGLSRTARGRAPPRRSDHRRCLREPVAPAERSCAPPGRTPSAATP
jgi:hypothetical protein